MISLPSPVVKVSGALNEMLTCVPLIAGAARPTQPDAHGLAGLKVALPEHETSTVPDTMSAGE
jgi:hypothetical protein